ncbi:MAG: phosphoribosylglycinamide formyltransferase [Clostridia bacterium]
MGMRIAAFASHGGTNLQAILDACHNKELNASVELVISNNSGSFALERARKAGVPACHMSLRGYGSEEELDKGILGLLEAHDVNLILLCGYMRKLGEPVVRAYEGRILNIHPALLPAHGGRGMYGMNVHQAVVDAGETHSGATVHLVNEAYDEGRILYQEKVRVEEGETPESLRLKVLEVEHRIYVETLRRILNGTIKL